MEISIILDYEVVYSKEFTRYAKELKHKNPNHSLMVKMENKFMTFLETDNHSKYIYSLVAGITMVTCNYTMAYAGDLNKTADTIRKTTSPVVELMASLGYPVTYFMLVVGMIMIITGKKSKGLEIMKWACIGYIGLQIVPFLLTLLEQIGKDLRSSLE